MRLHRVSSLSVRLGIVWQMAQRGPTETSVRNGTTLCIGAISLFTTSLEFQMARRLEVRVVLVDPDASYSYDSIAEVDSKLYSGHEQHVPKAYLPPT